MNGAPVKYGIYNAVAKKFQFGIRADSKAQAMKMLRNRIGKDAYKWRFEARVIREGLK